MKILQFFQGNRPASGPLRSVGSNEGVEFARSDSPARRMQSSPYSLNENTLIGLGYHILMGGQTDTAVEIFKLETQDYPQFWNAYDSLGEAYAKAGQKDLAIQNYEKSLQMDPKNQNAVERLKKLRAQSEPKILEQGEFRVVGIATRTSTREGSAFPKSQARESA